MLDSTASPFVLPPIPDAGQTLPWGGFGSLEYESIASLARLDGMMAASAKADLFWLTWLMKEAQYSNEIEGTVTTFDEIMGEHAGVIVPIERKNDVQEVLNYRTAMLEGLGDIRDGRPLSLSLIKALHAELLNGARGQTKTPGEWRHVQVHIGRPGEPLEKAAYIPPEPFLVQDLLENWERFIARQDINPVIQAAVMHAQFEMIHPFLDGNGRMGRLLITLFLASKKVLHFPCFYMSAYLQNHRDSYYAALGKISKQGDWNTWIEFFLNAVVKHSQANISLMANMTELYEESKREFSQITGSAQAVNVLDYMFEKPIFTIPDLIKQSKIPISNNGVMSLINRLEKGRLIEKAAEGSGRRPAVWRFTRLLQLLA